jgi:hypothetical protein
MAPLEIRHRSVRPISAKHAQASRFLQQSPTDYASEIRAHLEATGGHPQRTYRETYDPRSEEQFSSLWSLPAQSAMREARRIRELAKLQLSEATQPSE